MKLSYTENQYIEFKQAFNASAIETLVAFANSKGGTVYVGVDDGGEVKGIRLGKETVAQIVNEIGNISDGFMVTVFGESETLQATDETLQAIPIKRRMSREGLISLIEDSCSDKYVTIEQLALLVNRNAAYLKNELIPEMLLTGRLARLYPETPNHPNQAYKKKYE